MSTTNVFKIKLHHFLTGAPLVSSKANSEDDAEDTPHLIVD
jgi:hypothetical protein